MAVEIFTGGLAEILAEAARAHPLEACGLLIGAGLRVERIVRAANVATNPLVGFEVDPVTLLQAHRGARASGRAIIGSYHSHPNGRSEPSAVDAVRVNRAGELWLIAANGVVRGFLSSEAGFEPVDIVGVQGAGSPLAS
jgi:proteasome lid subunit RPN8/RPN11